MLMGDVFNVKHVMPNRHCFFMFPQLEEKVVQDSEQQLADLRRRSISVAPLRLRRTNPNRPITVESLCDWEGDKVVPLVETVKPRTNVRSVQSNMSYPQGFPVKRGEVHPEIDLRP